MGMFDTVIVQCECGEYHYFQSKGGPCGEPEAATCTADEDEEDEL